MKKTLWLFLAALLVVVPSAYAEEHFLQAEELSFSGPGIGFPVLVYEYGRDGVRVDLWVRANYSPLTGNVETTRADSGEVDLKDISFHEVADVGSSPWLHASSDFESRYTLGYLQEPGAYALDAGFGDGVSQTFALFEHDFSPFEPVESICRGKKWQINFDFTIWDLRGLTKATTVDIKVELEDKGRTLHFRDVPLVGVGGRFGWISIPLPNRFYRLHLAGQKLTTRWSISGETVTKEVFFPHPAVVRPSCDRG